jgi:hypothetical protein
MSVDPGPRPRRGLWLLAGIALYLVFLATSLPANILASWLLSASGDAFRIGQPDGTLWSGSGVLVTNVPGQDPLTTPISWSINPLWLIAGQGHIHLSGNDAETAVEASARLGYHHFVLQDALLRFPARALKLIYPPSALFAPRGRVELRVERIELNADGLHGGAELTWTGAGTAMTGATDLGEFRAELTGQGPAATIRFATVRGPLDMSGQGSWRVLGDGELALNGTVKLAPDAPTSLVPIVALAGPGGLNLRTFFPVARYVGTGPP